MFPLPPSLFSQLFVIVSSLSCVFVSITRSLFCFSSASEKQKLIKYGTRWSSISLNHHVIKMASLGDQLKRSRRTMSSPSDIYGPGYVNMLPLFSMYISCNYHFLQRFSPEICRGKKLLGECHQKRVLLQRCYDTAPGKRQHSLPGETFYLYLTSSYKNHQCLVTSVAAAETKTHGRFSAVAPIYENQDTHSSSFQHASDLDTRKFTDDLQVCKNLDASYSARPCIHLLAKMKIWSELDSFSSGGQ